MMFMTAKRPIDLKRDSGTSFEVRACPVGIHGFLSEAPL
jgi:hypothetical protein